MIDSCITHSCKERSPGVQIGHRMDDDGPVFVRSEGDSMDEDKTAAPSCLCSQGEESDGTSLGLAITRRIIEMHGKRKVTECGQKGAPFTSHCRRQKMYANEHRNDRKVPDASAFRRTERLLWRGSRVEGLCMSPMKAMILALTITSTLFLGSAGAVTITVCESGCDDINITSALSHSQPGDTIEVHGGTYDENLNIRKNVSLVGIADENGMPVINGTGHGSVITIAVEGVNITGFKLTNSGGCGCGDSGVRISSDNNTIYGNNITGNHYGVNIRENTTGNRIYANSFVNNSVNARDNGDNQWYGEAPSSGGTLRTILGYLGVVEPEYIGNYYDNYDEEEEGCAAAEGFCASPYNVTGKGNSTDSYPQASPRI